MEGRTTSLLSGYENSVHLKCGSHFNDLSAPLPDTIIYNEHQVINVQVPFMFKLAIDWLAALSGADASLASFTETNATLLALFASPVAVLIGYGIARTGVSACTGKCICFGILCYLVHKSK
jgi:hypothetical protein